MSFRLSTALRCTGSAAAPPWPVPAGARSARSGSFFPRRCS
nr:MAG TPA: hypothetical protein [Caudoviricetes sp.]